MAAPSKQKLEQLQQTIDVLNEHFPAAFPKRGGLPVKPLALDINRQVMAKVKELQLGLTWGQVRFALGYWCNRAYYYKAFKTATHRINLNGEFADALIPAHQQYAKERLKRLFKRSETKNHEAPTSLQNAQELRDEHQNAEKADHDAVIEAERAGAQAAL